MTFDSQYGRIDIMRKNIIFGKNQQRNQRLKHNHKITYQRWNNMFHEQKGCCAICGKHQSEQKKHLSVDHNHTTGKIRGLLCSNCNTMLGFAKENQEILKNAIKYLKKHE